MRLRRLDSIIEAVGNTPLVRLRSLEREVPGKKIYLKLEYMNPGGSVKDRPALRMMLDAIADGRLTKDKILIDATSGNTGVAYSLFGAALGYKVQLVMPKNVTQSRKDITQAYGTEIIYSDPMYGSDGAIRLVREIVEREPDRYFYPDQYSNPSNPLAHYLGTGREILEQVGDEITHFVTGLGTSGTAMGTIRRLKEHSRPIHCAAAEPAEALHGLEGLKHMASSIVPNIYDPHLPDEIVPVTTDDGWEMSDRLAEDEGLHVGHSTGANVWAALQMAKRDDARCVVTIAADRGDRYFAPMRWEKRYEW
ncbi:MAG: cysteine synthase family protein [Myxococcales bacterium]|jgi:cysteine synthase B|nr:cysteine synthase family protein [Myxococcales bacterium]